MRCNSEQNAGMITISKPSAYVAQKEVERYRRLADLVETLDQNFRLPRSISQSSKIIKQLLRCSRSLILNSWKSVNKPSPTSNPLILVIG